MTKSQPKYEAQYGEVSGTFCTGHTEEHNTGEFAVEEEEGAEELPRTRIVKLHGKVSAEERNHCRLTISPKNL